MLCVALCVALSAQMTMALMERLQHAFQIDHAPSGLAGVVFDHGHHLKVDVQHSSDQSHDGDHHMATIHGDDAVHAAELTGGGLLDGDETSRVLKFDHSPITHHHHGSGMLTPWLVSAPAVIAVMPVKSTVLEFGTHGHPDAPAWRRDRPPKLHLERFV
jgi:hypothetical protein